MPQTDAWASIREALETRLSTVTGSHPIAYMNQNFVPTKGTLWLRGTLLPAQTAGVTIGLDGNDLYQGLFQVDVFAPQGKGSGQALRIADDVIEHYAKGTVLTAGVFRIRIDNGWILPPLEEPEWYQVPVTIGWLTYGDN